MSLRRIAALVAALSAGSHVAMANPLTMRYQVTDAGNGLFNYRFTLTLDNHDNTWQPGMGWGWLIFGDAPYPGPTAMPGFIGNPADLPVGPWTGNTTSGGGHNGPTMNYVLDLWVPTAVGESLTWSGTAPVNLQQGQMLWSSIQTNGLTPQVQFEVASRVVPCPADYDHNGQIQPADIALFVNTWLGSLQSGDLAGDFDGNGVVQPADVSLFVSTWFAAVNTGC